MEPVPTPECRGDTKCPPGSPPEGLDKHKEEIMQCEADQMLLYVVMYGAFFLSSYWSLEAVQGSPGLLLSP